MTEQDLIDLGFKKVEVSATESGYEKEWYYYTYNLIESINSLQLISDDNEVAERLGWSVSFFNYESLEIRSVDKLKKVIQLFKDL